MLAGALELQLTADVTRLAQDLYAAKQMTNDSMSAMASSMEKVQKTIDAMADAENARASVFSRTLDETKRLLGIAKDAADKTAESLAALKIDPTAVQIPDSAIESLKTWQEHFAYAIGGATAIGIDKAKTLWEEFKNYTEKTVVIWGVALAAGVTAAAVSAVYAVYKSIDWMIGLLTGDSYKTKEIAALIAMNKEVKTLQDNLPLTAVGASSVNEALKVLGTSSSSYTDTLGKATLAAHTNTDELDRLGITYKDQNGVLLTSKEILANAAVVLGTYKEGWDRNSAAQAIGMGSEKQIQDALAVTEGKIQTAKERLIDYGLIIGPGTQEQVGRYETAMKVFARESDLTGQGFKRVMADNFMPILTDLAEFFSDGFPKAVFVFRQVLATVTSAFYALKTGIYVVVTEIITIVDTLGTGIGALGAAAAAALSGNLTGAKEILVQGWQDAKAKLGSIGDNISDQMIHNAQAINQAFGADSLGANAAASAATNVGKAWEGADVPGKVKTVKDSYDQLIASIETKIATAQGEVEITAKVTDAQRIENKLYSDMANSIVVLTDAELENTISKLNQLDAINKAKDAQLAAKIETDLYTKTLQGMEAQLGRTNDETIAERTIYALTIGTLKDLSDEHKAALLAVAGEIDQRKEAAAILKAETEYRKALDDIMQKSNDTIAAARIAAKNQADQYEFELSLIGKTSFEIQVLNAQRQIEVEYRAKLKALGAIYGDDVAGFNAAVNALDDITQGQRDRLIPALERRNQLERDWSTGAVAAYNEYVNGATNAAKQSHDLWAAAFKGMEDAAFEFFRHGTLSGEGFVNAIKDQLARLAAQKFTVWITGELSGIGTTLLDALGLGGLMKSVTGSGAGAAVTGGAVVAGAGATGSVASLLGSTSMGTLDIAGVSLGGSTAAVSTAVTGGSTGAAAGGAFAGLGGAALAVGGALAVIAIGELLKNSQRPFELAGTGSLSTSGLSVEKQMPNGSEWFTPTSASYQKLKFTDGDMGFAYQVMGDGIPIAAVDAATFVNQYHGPASAVSFHGAGGQLAGAKDYQLTEVADLLASFTAEGYDAATLLWAGATNYGLSEADLRLAGKSRSLPGFYAGGMFEGGLRIVGERGPELEATGPSRIFDAQTTASMLRSGGASNEDVVTELRAMRVQLAQLQQEARRTADATNGNPEAPMLTEVVV